MSVTMNDIDEKEMKRLETNARARERYANRTLEQKEAHLENNRKWRASLPPEVRQEMDRRYNLNRSLTIAAMSEADQLLYYAECRARRQRKIDRMTQAEKVEYYARRRIQVEGTKYFIRTLWQLKTPEQKDAQMRKQWYQGLKRIQRVSIEEFLIIEERTRQGIGCEASRKDRIAVITATKVYRIVANVRADLQVLAYQMMIPRAQSPPTIHMWMGVMLERFAAQRFREMYKIAEENFSYPVGLHLHPELGYVGATPDAMYVNEENEKIVVEFKYSSTPIYKGKKHMKQGKHPSEGFPILNDSSNSKNRFTLRRRCQYYYQVIVQIICTGAAAGKIVVYHDGNPNKWEFWIETITRDEAVAIWPLIEEKLAAFYKKFFLHNCYWHKLPYSKIYLAHLSTLLPSLPTSDHEDDEDDDDYGESDDEDEVWTLSDDMPTSDPGPRSQVELVLV